MKRRSIFRGHWLALGGFLLIAACSKDHTETPAAKEAGASQETAAYLKLKNADEVNLIVDKVAEMSDEEYLKWKKSVGLGRTLYDRFVDVENKMLTASSEQVPSSDAGFFYFKDGLLRSKNGILLDRILNDAGVIEVGGLVIRYEDGNIYYAKTDGSSPDNLKLLVDNRSTVSLLDKAASADLSKTTAQSVQNGLTGINTLAVASDHTVYPTSASSQSFDYVLLTQRKDWSKTRHWTEIKESYLIVPASTSGSNVTWNVSYRFYMQFSQHKKVFFTWNTYPARTQGFSRFNGVDPDWKYYPGGVSYENAEMYYKTNYFGGGYSPSLPGDMWFSTVDATHPTHTIYRSQATQNVPTSGSLGGPIALKSAQLSFMVRCAPGDIDVWTTYEIHYNP